MKKLIFLIFIIITGLTLFTNCKQKPHIGLLMANLQQARWEKDMNMFKEKISELGATCETANADGDADKQFDQAKEMIDNGAQALVIVPVDQNKAGEIVKYAHKYRIPVISYDRLIKNCNLDYYISTDNIEVGELQASYLTKIKPKGNYGIIGGSTADNNAFLLNLGQMNILQPLIDKGDITIAFNQYTKSWSLHEGYEVCKKYLDDNEDKKLDAVIAGNDDIATGVISALQERNLQGTVLVAGQDADIKAIRNIVAGNQTMTVYKPIKAMAYTAAEAACKISDGIAPSNMNITVNNGNRLVPAILLKSQIVNKQNINLTVVPEGFISEQEIKNKK